ncbi:mechanosensitive ion channel family protein [Haloferax mediterranei ATCC 33500]|uniref:Mechanosensitive ion channel n=1 Tax=Haloferax mediterranei (strain ATCC 33500 / DSM 1411 / JCM 8866 / NBRC 14739 / NCIMB 2177 / R-4) TaxID=523841 RepID=I3R3Z0_HALMT|nr:mechanosensitive ion channel family protein [Haloferax mediterranei]AFK18950.1 mechanosensitive ion channel [Haloferax mediterranei ATCC 33500]AHZ21688.1 mechanosensitive ion channel protein MscS [Haloferax mediterranei ATCC 33500]EMA03191.1 mechanosensitive ion channel [Haloferax mediterranei ATCC 33500]MDX5989042.1 mechanosensitive ion channel family protein [Haloferax mediterranei ATCC 33500]QCQ75435.1 mechanosensitive ion channel family protein [Haloferax mediterranei ATCC 33500]
MSQHLSDFLSGLSAAEATLFVLIVSVGGAFVMEAVVLRLLFRYTRRTETSLDNIVVKELRWPIVITISLTGIYLFAQTPAVAEALVVDSAVLHTFFGRPSVSLGIIVWAWALNRLVNRLVEAVKDKGHQYDFAPVFSNVWTIVVSVGTIGMLLYLWGIEITPLFAGAGIAGIAVGFAAKDTVANFFGGIALYFDDTYKIGDYVVLDSGEAGTVVKVGIRSTTLLTRDDLLVTVPNSVLNAAKIINESAPNRRRRLKVPIGVAYGTDIDEFEQVLTDLALDEPLVLDTPRPRPRFRRFGPDALEYELVCWVNSPLKRGKATHNLNREIYTRLNAADIGIPYPQRDVHVHSVESETPARNPEQSPMTELSNGGDRRSRAPTEFGDEDATSADESLDDE